MIHINQTKYIQSILKQYNIENYKSLTISLDANIKFLKDMATLTRNDINSIVSNPYQSTIDNLVHTIIGTQNDIAYVVRVVSQYITNLGPLHWIAIKQTFCFLKGPMIMHSFVTLYFSLGLVANPISYYKNSSLAYTPYFKHLQC